MLVSSTNSTSSLTEPFEGQYSKQVCDPCHRRRAKCDRETPTCRQCIEKNTPCSYNRQLKLKRRDSDGQSWQAQMQILPLGRQPNKPTRKRRSKQEMAMARGEFLSIPPSSKRNSLEPSLTPTPPSNGQFKTLNQTSINLGMNPNGELCQLAVDTYMNNINPLFPLVFPSSLISYQRSEFLMTAIYVTGLGLLPNSAEVEFWLLQYSNTLMRYVSNGILLVPTLDTLQALLVNYLGLTHQLHPEALEVIPTLAESLQMDPPSNLVQKCEQHMAFMAVKYLFPSTSQENSEPYLVPVGLPDLTWQTLAVSGMRLQDLGGMVIADHFLHLSQLQGLIPKEGTPYNYQRGWRRLLDTWRQIHQCAEEQLSRLPSFLLPILQDDQWLDNFHSILTMHSLVGLVQCFQAAALQLNDASTSSIYRHLLQIKLTHSCGFSNLSQLAKSDLMTRSLSQLETQMALLPHVKTILCQSQLDLLIHICRQGYDRLLFGPSP